IDELGTLDERLRDLGTAIAFPPTPPLAAMVADRLRQPPPRMGLARPIGRGLALAVAATILLVGIAAAFGLGLGGLRLTFGPASFSPAPSLLVGPGLGEATTLDDARRDVEFALRVPELAELGDPDLVYLAEPPTGGAVTLLYGERPGFPPDPGTGIGLIVTEFRADIGPELFEKLIDTGVRVTATEVNGNAGWWVAGGDHFFFYRDANGRVVDTTLRLASDTLIWEEDGVTHRVERAPSLADALRVAESLP
ncbi:MAG TPA: hypothetical protein VL687_06970, partial [Methylomirabilota bacterium]|nr:hypothetical protein [Methylomirabilota bacterium]